VSRAAAPSPSALEALKGCCAAAYGSDAVAMLLGPAYHPGGLELSRHLGRAMRLSPGERLVDVGCGPGTGARFLAREFGVRVHGVDLSRTLVERAEADVRREGLEGIVSFEVADAEHLPLADGSFDAVVAECALCTFPSKRRAVGELARVVRVGGRIGLADVVVDPERLPPELATLAGWIACLAGAVPLDGYRGLLEEAGIAVRLVERHDEALAEMAREAGTRLRALASLGRPEVAGIDTARADRIVETVIDAVRRGILGYVLLVGERVEREEAIAA
jgi:hypothetical protein